MTTLLREQRGIETYAPDSISLNSRDDIMSAIYDLRPDVLQTIEDIVAYNQSHPENPIILDQNCMNFMRICGSTLNALEK